MLIYDLPLSRDEVQDIINRSELCAEATLPGQQIRDLAMMAMQAIEHKEKSW